MTVRARRQRLEQLVQTLRERIVVLDGAMGTMIQSYELSENEFRGERFQNHTGDLRGNNDLLNLTRPNLIEEIHREFLFYPTYLHQKEDLLQPAYQPALRKLLEQPQDNDRITFSYWARAEELLEISEQGKVDNLEPHHIWTTAYAQSKLHWKPMLPLSVLLLRIYKLEQPVTVPYLPEYGGCTSWVEVLSDVNLGRMEPVLNDAEFQRRCDDIKGSLGLTVTAG